MKVLSLKSDEYKVLPGLKNPDYPYARMKFRKSKARNIRTCSAMAAYEYLAHYKGHSLALRRKIEKLFRSYATDVDESMDWYGVILYNVHTIFQYELGLRYKEGKNRKKFPKTCILHLQRPGAEDTHVVARIDGVVTDSLDSRRRNYAVIGFWYKVKYLRDDLMQTR